MTTAQAGGDRDYEAPPPGRFHAFVLLALGAVLLMPAVVAHLSSGLTVFAVMAVVILVLRILLPVAVMWGVRSDMRTNWALIGAAMVWTWLPFLIDLLPGVGLRRFDTSAGTLMDDMPAAIVLVLRAVAYLGPLFIVLELARRRSSIVTWPRVPVAAAVVVVAGLAIWQFETSLDYLRTTSLDGNLSGRDWLSAIRDAMRDVAILPVAALAWVSLSAVRAKEAPTSVWLGLAIGSALMLAAELLAEANSLTTNGVVSLAGNNPSDALVGTVNQVQEVVYVALSVALAVAWAFVIRAFAGGVPERRPGEPTQLVAAEA